mgnify:CR=1 FL=1
MKPDTKILSRSEEVLAVPLTTEELLAFGQHLAAVNGEIGDQEAEFAAVKTEWKEKLDGLEKERGRVASIIRSRAEHRFVKCEEVAHFSENVVRIIRLDTGEVVRERNMEANERQGVLRLTKAEKAEA